MKTFKLWLETLGDLIQDSESEDKMMGKMKPIDKARVSVDKKERTLLFCSDVEGSTGEKYFTSIKFLGVNFKKFPFDGQMELGNYYIPTEKEKHYFTLLSYLNDVKVDCTCKHFKERIGKSSGKKTLHDYSKPQLCKHLYALVKYLKEEKGVLIEKPSLFNKDYTIDKL